MRQLGLSDYVKIHCQDSLTFLRETELTFQFGFFDSYNPIRPKEYQVCVERGILTGVAAFHDTSPCLEITIPSPIPNDQRIVRATLHDLARKPGSTGYFENLLSRGLFGIFTQPGSGESAV